MSSIQYSMPIGAVYYVAIHTHTIRTTVTQYRYCTIIATRNAVVIIVIRLGIAFWVITRISPYQLNVSVCVCLLMYVCVSVCMFVC